MLKGILKAETKEHQTVTGSPIKTYSSQVKGNTWANIKTCIILN